MNKTLLLAAVICVLTAGIHIIMGSREIVTPFLDSDLAQVPKLTLYAVWYMVSAVLILTAATLFYISFKKEQGGRELLFFIGILYTAFGLVFLIICFTHFDEKLFLELPQWILLLPIGGLTLWEAYTWQKAIRLSE